MSLRLEMLQVARRSPKVLGESGELVADFLRSQLNNDGGFQDRDGKSDLYYTVFGIEGLMALQADVSARKVARYLQSFDDGEDLDLVHLTCLARSWAALPEELQDCPRERIARRLESYRAADGGYHAQTGADRGTLYGCFLVVGALQDLGYEIKDTARILQSIASLEVSDGSYTNQHEVPLGMTPPSAAAAALLRQLGATPHPGLGRWLLSRCHKQGGFFATEVAPVPDLLSTATALHALAGLQVDFASLVEPCLDFIDTLWTNRGGFFGSWEDDQLDCEYTYYGLLALGHLSSCSPA